MLYNYYIKLINKYLKKWAVLTQAALVLGRFDSRAVLVSGHFDPDS